MFPKAFQVSAHFVHRPPQVIQLAVNVFHLVMATFVVVASIVMFMDPSLNFFGNVMEPGGMQVLNGSHCVMHPFIMITLVAIVLLVPVFIMTLVMITFSMTPAFLNNSSGFTAQPVSLLVLAPLLQGFNLSPSVF